MANSSTTKQSVSLESNISTVNQEKNTGKTTVTWRPDAWLREMRELLGDGLRCLYLSAGDSPRDELLPGVSVRWLDISNCAPLDDSADERSLSDAAGDLTLEEASFDAVVWDGCALVPAGVEDLMREAARYLKPSGVCLVAAPIEALEVNGSIAPPAYWGDQLRLLKYERALRFNPESGVLEWLGGRSDQDNWAILRDAFLEQGVTSKLNTQTEGESLFLTPTEESDDEQEAFYLLNPNPYPLSIDFSYRSQDESHPDIHLNDLKLRYLGGEDRNGEWRHRWSGGTLPPGGCRLRLELSGVSLSDASLNMKAKALDAESFLKTLSFDHYQRYRLVADAAQALIPAGSKILDVGGALGFLPLFASGRNVTVADLSWDDSPNSRICRGERLPWPTQSFHAVVCVDTLEHVPPQERAAFLQELRRVSSGVVILCCPFDEPHVAEAESVLREFLLHRLGKSDRFLDEHREYSLPNLGEVSDSFEKEEWSVIGLPNGYLPRWLAMQFVQFIMSEAPELFESRAQINSLYNEIYYASDNRFPSYRIALAATREPLSESHRKALSRLISTEGELPSGEMWGVASLTACLAQFGLMREKEHYLSQKGRQIERLLDHIRNLEASQQESQRHADHLTQMVAEQQKLQEGFRSHINNLDERETQRFAHIENLDQHIQNLEKLITERDNHARNLQVMLDEGLKRSHDHDSEFAAKEKRLQEIDTFLEEVQTYFSVSKSNRLLGKKRDKDLSDKPISLEQLLQYIAQMERSAKEVRDLLELSSQTNLPDTVREGSVALRDVLEENLQLHEELERLRGSFFVRLLRAFGLTPKPIVRDGA